MTVTEAHSKSNTTKKIGRNSLHNVVDLTISLLMATIY